MISPQGFASVVGVHEGVDREVHDHEPPCVGRVLGPGVEGVQRHSDVVVPAMRDKRINLA